MTQPRSFLHPSGVAGEAKRSREAHRVKTAPPLRKEESGIVGWTIFLNGISHLCSRKQSITEPWDM